MVRKSLFVILFILVAFNTLAQKPFASVYLNKKSTFVQAPVQLTIKVYSPTWFSDPLEFTDISIDGTFIIPFTQTQPGNTVINGENYVSLTFYYLVYPYKTGKVKIPSIEVIAHCPPPGDYKGQTYTLNTKATSFSCKALPESENEVYVANSVRLKDSWNKELNKIKSGDVVDRTLTQISYGTIPNFVKPVKVDSLTKARIYPKSDETTQHIDKKTGTVYAIRKQTFTYLFTDTGTCVIPGANIHYFSPYALRYYEKSSEDLSVLISENPNPTMISSIADSLKAKAFVVPETSQPKQSTLEKIVYFVKDNYGYLLLIIGLLFSLKLLLKAWKKFTSYVKLKRTTRNSSESKFYVQLLISIGLRSTTKQLAKLYRWLLKKPIDSASLLSLKEAGILSEENLKDLTETNEKQTLHERLQKVKLTHKIRGYFKKTVRRKRNTLKNWK